MHAFLHSGAAAVGRGSSSSTQADEVKVAVKMVTLRSADGQYDRKAISNLQSELHVSDTACVRVHTHTHTYTHTNTLGTGGGTHIRARAHTCIHTVTHMRGSLGCPM